VNPQQHSIFVCTTCASKWENGRTIGTSGGKKLLDRLQQLQQDLDLESQFQIQPVGCMSACTRACAIAFTSVGKHTYLFGDLPSDLPDDRLTDILECAKNYQAHPAGILPWADRPEPLKGGILAKIPPLEVSQLATIPTN
jgi:predicted metal-binding protein